MWRKCTFSFKIFILNTSLGVYLKFQGLKFGCSKFEEESKFSFRSKIDLSSSCQRK